MCKIIFLDFKKDINLKESFKNFSPCIFCKCIYLRVCIFFHSNTVFLLLVFHPTYNIEHKKQEKENSSFMMPI